MAINPASAVVSAASQRTPRPNAGRISGGQPGQSAIGSAVQNMRNTRPARRPAPSSSGGVSTDDVGGGGAQPSAPGKPAWQVLRENGRGGTGSAAGNRAAAAAAGLPGFGMMDKPLPVTRPAAQPPPGPTVSTVPAEIQGRMAQLARERGVQGDAPSPTVSELPQPSTPDPMPEGGLPGFGPGPSMSKPLMPVEAPPAEDGGQDSPFSGMAMASLLARLRANRANAGNQGYPMGGEPLGVMTGGGLQGGPAAYGDPGFLAGRPEGPVGGGPGNPGLYRDPRQLRTDLGGIGGRAMGGF